jgi:hypothetical protein
MGSYWSIEECGWVDYSEEPDVTVEAPEQRVPEDEPVLGTLS